jgi:8-oxo-dGTP pyrophosphatase MutT (NUDIX family)
MNAPSLRPAATVIVLRDGPHRPEVFMVRRHEGTAFMGGAYVFPGGRVDQGDFDHAGGDRGLAFRYAAIRELFEEVGVLLARAANGSFVSLAGADVHARFVRYRTDVHSGVLGLAALANRERLTLAPDALVLVAHWVTPPVDVRRFDTLFFVTRVPPDQTPAHDAAETTASVWTDASSALRLAERDEIVLPPPTWTTLRELEPFDSVDAVLRWAARRAVVRREPLFVEEGGRRMLLLPGDPANPEGWAEPLPHETRFVHENGRWRATRP